MDIQEYRLPEFPTVTGLSANEDGASLAGQVFEHQQADIVATAPVEAVVAEERGRLRTAWEAAKNAVKATVMMVELLPVTNEGIRYGAFAYTQTITNNPLVGAAVLGGTTLLIEGASALASAEWVAKDKVKDVIDRVDEKLTDTKFSWLSPKRYIPENLKVSPVAEAGLAMTLGTLAVLEAKQRENPERTANQNRQRGMFTAGWLSAVFAAEGAMLAEGIDNPTNPGSVGIALLGVAGMFAFGKWAKKRYLSGNPNLVASEERNDE